MQEKSCRVFDMGYKEVINLHDGARLGYVGDVEIELESGKVMSLVIPGRMRLFGLLGRDDDYVIPWESIEKIGDDIILVRHSGGYGLRSKPKRGAIL